LTLSDLVRRYIEEVLPRKPKSQEVETYILKAFLRHPICRKPLSRLTPPDFASYRDERLLEITSKSLSRQLSPVHNLFEIAKDEWGLPLRENPLDKVKLKATDNRRERRLKDGEYERLLEVARTRQNPLIERVIIFAIETAMRRGEILNLKWDQVDLKRRCVTILESKNGHSRSIPLTPSALVLLHSCREEAGEDDRVFPLTPNALKMTWGRMIKTAEIKDLHFHDLTSRSYKPAFSSLDCLLPKSLLCQAIVASLRCHATHTRIRPERISSYPNSRRIRDHGILRISIALVSNFFHLSPPLTSVFQFFSSES
jgi:integrase